MKFSEACKTGKPFVTRHSDGQNAFSVFYWCFENVLFCSLNGDLSGGLVSSYDQRRDLFESTTDYVVSDWFEDERPAIYINPGEYYSTACGKLLGPFSRAGYMCRHPQSTQWSDCLKANIDDPRGYIVFLRDGTPHPGGRQDIVLTQSVSSPSIGKVQRAIALGDLVKVSINDKEFSNFIIDKKMTTRTEAVCRCSFIGIGHDLDCAYVAARKRS